MIPKSTGFMATAWFAHGFSAITGIGLAALPATGSREPQGEPGDCANSRNVAAIPNRLLARVPLGGGIGRAR
jgi:hypothetical protein